jgi:hypothetical protein
MTGGPKGHTELFSVCPSPFRSSGPSVHRSSPHGVAVVFTPICSAENAHSSASSAMRLSVGR